MHDLRELYQEVILDHNKNPRNYKVLGNATHHAKGHNPLCGDRIQLFLNIENDIIVDITFQGNGCAISQSSASLMTQFLTGKSVQEAQHIFDDFHDLVTGKASDPEQISKLGKLAVFSGVQEFPVRVKCASLAWHTLISALRGDDQETSTE